MTTPKIDISINVYGKPYQTALTIQSLVKYSGHHIGKIFLTFEKKQPVGFSKELLISLLQGLDIHFFTPSIFIGIKGSSFLKLFTLFRFFRYAIRYQYAWENTKSDYLFISHNDMVYTNDILAEYIDKINGHIAIGQVGQCWNCPAYKKHCDGSIYWEYRPNITELTRMYNEFNNIRKIPLNRLKHSWPLPECRLNEMAAMFNMKLAKPITIPEGKFAPIGLMSLDIGTEWFKDISQSGFKVINHSYTDYARHAMFNKLGNGHSSLFNQDQYDFEEQMAKEMLELRSF
jgi:hypothetical protein